MLIKDHGLEGDAHAGDWHRQISLLAMESIKKMQEKGLQVGPGDFAENITTEGIDLVHLPVGTKLQLGPEALGEVTQIGKFCHHHCAIYHKAGDCVMPREGIFMKVLKGGMVASGDEIKVVGAPGDRMRVAILTASDKGSRGEREDRSAGVIREMVTAAGCEVAAYDVVPDEQDELVEKMIDYADRRMVDLILTTGGTGLSARDVTPEATRKVIEREIPGITEAIRAAGLSKTPHAMLSRAIAGNRGNTLIINLPGSPRAVRENLEVVLPALPHALEILQGKSGECARPDNSQV
jgi:molybdenum cofactor synthesis domain-containing protein